MALPSLDTNDKKKEKKSQGLPSFDMPAIDNLDDGFESVPLDDVNNFEDNKLNEDIYEEVSLQERTALPKVDIEEANSYQTEDDYNPDYEEDIKNQDVGTQYVDFDNKEVIPMGGSRSKRKVKSSEFDKRNNTLAMTKIVRSVVLVILVLFFLLGLKNTLFPSHVYSKDQIKQFAAEGTGQTGFPEERGRAFVESFTEVYLTFDRNKPEYKELLNYYYGEDKYVNMSGQRTRQNTTTDSSQYVIISPQVYESELLTEYSALYKVSAFVSNTDGSQQMDGRGSGRWLSFAINVYYDAESGGLAITEDSPSLIPTYRILNQSALPREALLGNGQVNEEILPALTPTINGFIKAYANASIASHEEILQYIDDKNNIDLYDGFGGSVELNGEVNNSIKKTVYNSDDGIYRVDVEVSWIDSAATQGSHRVEYKSRYVMQIKSVGDGRYVVTRFQPLRYYAQ